MLGDRGVSASTARPSSLALNPVADDKRDDVMIAAGLMNPSCSHRSNRRDPYGGTEWLAQPARNAARLVWLAKLEGFGWRAQIARRPGLRSEERRDLLEVRRFASDSFCIDCDADEIDRIRPR
jgi:hypothetical protein